MTTQEEIIKQLRIMRAYEREQLLNSLHANYIVDKANALRDIGEEYNQLIEAVRVADRKYQKAYGSWFKTNIEILAKEARAATREFELCKDTKRDIETIFDATHNRNIKLREFDIETERMILASICGVEEICGNKKALPQLSE